MKKLEMIVTSVVVLAIVGGAFAFKTKGSSFCVKTGAGGNCTTFKQGFRLTTGAGTTYKIFLAWDGTPTLCTLDVNNSCIPQFRITTD